jgi:hypothetical protein
VPSSWMHPLEQIGLASHFPPNTTRSPQRERDIYYEKARCWF